MDLILFLRNGTTCYGCIRPKTVREDTSETRIGSEDREEHWVF